ncbi:MAG: hypothetical protein L7S55_09070 [Luminiphilus sp.]|nr:hypothetical protein [Luminiphilus sp.]
MNTAEDTRTFIEPYRSLIDQALEHAGGTHDFEDVLDRILIGDMLFWPGKKSCMVTEIVQYPRKRAMHVFLAAGDLTEIKSMEPDLRTFAKKLQCDGLSLAGRRGWVRALKDIGFTEGHAIVVKNL